MSQVTAQIHIDTLSFASTNPLPPTPPALLLTSSSPTHLTPSTELGIRIQTATTNKPQHLSNLADAIDIARANLNHILTSWKDHAGKEISTTSSSSTSRSNHPTTSNNNGEDEEDEDDEDEEEEE